MTNFLWSKMKPSEQKNRFQCFFLNWTRNFKWNFEILFEVLLIINLLSWTFCHSLWWQHPLLSYCNQIWSIWRFYLLTLSNMTSMTEDFEKFKNFFWIFPYHWLLFKSDHIILKMTAPIGLKRTFSGSQINFSEKSLWCQMASTFSSRTSLVSFWFLPHFVVVFIVIRLVVMSYWSPMHSKHSYTPIEAYLSVFIDFRLNLLSLVPVNHLKIIFRKIFWTLTNH